MSDKQFSGSAGCVHAVCVCVLDLSVGSLLWPDPGMKTSSVDLLRSCLCFQTVIYSLMNAQCVCVFCACTFHECASNSGPAAAGHSLLCLHTWWDEFSPLL